MSEKTICMVGCGKMGGAILKGWIDSKAVQPEHVFIQEKHPSEDLLAMQAAYGFALNASDMPTHVDIVVLAVKPQVMQEVLEDPQQVKGRCYVSVAAGLDLAFYARILGESTPVIRIMPNTPVSVGRGVSAMAANAAATEDEKAFVKTLFESVGIVAELESESQIDAATAVSGSGPGYVFALIEAFAAAGEAEGLPPKLAMTLARQTICGAGELAYQSSLSATQLREMVTSPNGTTEAGLSVLRADSGISPLMRKTVAAAAARSREMS